MDSPSGQSVCVCVKEEVDEKKGMRRKEKESKGEKR